MLNKRVHVLFEKELWKKIVKSAKAQNISAGEYVRRSISHYLESQKELIKDKSPMSFKGLFNARGK